MAILLIFPLFFIAGQIWILKKFFIKIVYECDYAFFLLCYTKDIFIPDWTFACKFESVQNLCYSTLMNDFKSTKLQSLKVYMRRRSHLSVPFVIFSFYSREHEVKKLYDFTLNINLNKLISY